MRVLGLDVGSAHIGLALGDTETAIASPWGVLQVTDQANVLNEIRTLIDREGVKRVVVGMPRRLHDASEKSAQQQSIEIFVNALRGIGVSVDLEDETWSSKIAAKQVLERGERGKRDDLAAAVILETWLQRHVST